MSFNRYYQEELNYLQELGAEFARRNAALAPFLARESFDPDVERLLEGFAFLTGRLRQKLDDELPELSQSIASIVAPYLLQPVPAMTVVQFEPIATAGRARMTVPRGAEVGSRPIRGGRCRFRTCYDVKLVPARVVDASAETVAGRARVRMELVLTDRAQWEEIRLDRLRVYLAPGGGGGPARTLCMTLCTQCRKVRAEDASGWGFDLPGGAVRPVGFAPEEAVLPFPARIAPGYRVLQEYFVFPDKFMFLDIVGLEPTAGFVRDRLVLSFDLDEPLSEASGVTAQNLRLNATPVVNVFDTGADPIRVEHRKGEYLLTARDSAGNRHTVHSVRKVTGRAGGARGATVEYAPLESFEGLGRAERHACFAVRRARNPVTGEVDVTIGFGHADGAPYTAGSETVSVEVLATNGALAQEIPSGHLDQMTDGSPSFATFRDVQRITPELPPPLDAVLMRRAIVAVASGFGSLTRVEVLRMVMSACNPRIHFDHMERQRHAQMVEGVVDVAVAPFDWLIEGAPVRGWDVTVTVEESRFGGTAPAWLFCRALGALLDDLAGLNTVHRVNLVAREENRHVPGPVRVGHRALV